MEHGEVEGSRSPSDVRINELGEGLSRRLQPIHDQRKLLAGRRKLLHALADNVCLLHESLLCGTYDFHLGPARPAESVEKLTDGPVGIGTRFRAKWKGGPPVEVTMVRYDRPFTWEMHNGGPLEVAFKARLEAVSDGTRLTVDFDARPHGWFRLVFPLFLLKLRRDEKANMTHIRQALERVAS